MNESKKYEIDFIGWDEKEHQFRAEINPLNTNWMYTFDNWRHCFAGRLSDVKYAVNAIRQNCNIIEEQ